MIRISSSTPTFVNQALSVDARVKQAPPAAEPTATPSRLRILNAGKVVDSRPVNVATKASNHGIMGKDIKSQMIYAEKAAKLPSAQGLCASSSSLPVRDEVAKSANAASSKCVEAKGEVSPLWSAQVDEKISPWQSPLQKARPPHGFLPKLHRDSSVLKQLQDAVYVPKKSSMAGCLGGKVWGG